MKWSSRSFQIAAAQISLVCEPSKTIEEIQFMLGYPSKQQKVYCAIIDKALAGDNFPSLRLVIIDETTPQDYFPILQSRNLLKVTKH